MTKIIWVFVDGDGDVQQFILNNEYVSVPHLIPAFRTKVEAQRFKKKYKTDKWHKTSWKIKKIII